MAEGKNHTAETGEQQSRGMGGPDPRVLIRHWGRDKPATTDSIVSLKMVFQDWIPDLLLFWDFFRVGRDVLP